MRVLDLACGAGRHHRALRAAGLRAVGIDLSWALLAQAQSLGSEAIARGDMRRLPFADRTFDAVLSFFTSFGYFDDADDDRRALREVARILDRRGRYLLDFLDAAHVERSLVPRSERTVPGYRLVEERRIEGGRVRKRVTIEADGATAPVTYEEVVTLYPRRDLERLLDEAAFEVEDAFGSFEGGPAGGGDRVILAARKR
jgi:SAM-dependent methyltransferase